MPRLLKRQITDLITYREGTYEIISAIKYETTGETTGKTKDAGETKNETALPTNYQYMINVLTGINFFHSLGGKELLSYTVAPRTLDTILLQVQSISPDRTREIRHIFTLKFASPDKLTNFINLK